ncbi:MAG: T9SS type A sorting domain-containing protein [Saprospiraceae bacterium]|nr:T9SS type A sorting domain-containing protein [Candidatus Opimibacter iunctus]
MKTILPLLFCLPLSTALSQSPDPTIISTQGGIAKGSAMSMSWTIGDLVTGTAMTDGSLYTQGFQQPTLSVQELGPEDITGVEQINTDATQALKATVFPNPFGSDITVTVDNQKREYYVEIFDPSGNLLYRNLSSNPQENINLNSLPVAQYLLRIGISDSGPTQIFRIIKAH